MTALDALAERLQRVAVRNRGADVRVAHVGRDRGGRPVLDDVSFRLRPGELVALTGPSGSGKSTLVRILAGLDGPDRGTVSLDGGPAGSETLRARVGYLPQRDVLHPELSPRRALHYAAALRLPHQSAEQRAARVAQLLDALELQGVSERPVAQLSGGERKRTALATELVTEPGLILLDEPTGNLEPPLRRRLWEQFRRLADAGHTILVVTHQLDHLEVCDRVLDLGAGLSERDDSEPGELTPFVRARPAPLVELGLLCQRNAEVLLATPRRLALLLGQGVLIGALIALALEAPPLLLFMLVIATLWLGTSVAAGEVVRERALLELERRAGLRLSTYLLSKLLVAGGVVAAQTALLLGVAHWLRPPPGGGLALLGVLWLTAAVAVCVGLAISAASRTPERANALVPLVLIPQVLFGGALTQSGDLARAVGWTQPSRWAYDLALRTAVATEPGALIDEQELARAQGQVAALEVEATVGLAAAPRAPELAVGSPELEAELSEAGARRRAASQEARELRAELEALVQAGDALRADEAQLKRTLRGEDREWKRLWKQRKELRKNDRWKKEMKRHSDRWLRRIKRARKLQRRKRTLDREAERFLRRAGPELARLGASGQDARVAEAVRAHLARVTAAHAARVAELQLEHGTRLAQLEERLREAASARAAVDADWASGRVVDLVEGRDRPLDALALALFAVGAFGLGLAGLRLR